MVASRWRHGGATVDRLDDSTGLDCPRGGRTANGVWALCRPVASVIIFPRHFTLALRKPGRTQFDDEPSLMSTDGTRSMPVRSLVSLVLLVGGIALVGGVWAAIAAGGANERDEIVLTMVGAATLSLVFPVGVAMTSRPYDVLHPLNFVALSLFFGVFARTLFLVFSDSPAAVEVLEGYPLTAVLPGAILSAIGSAFICAGYLAGRPLRLSLFGFEEWLQRFDASRMVRMLPIFFIICSIATVLFLRATGFQYSGLSSLSIKRRVVIDDVESSYGYFRLVAQDIPRVILLLLTATFLMRSYWSSWLKPAMVAFFMLAVTLPFLSSSRSNVLIAVISLCAVINRIRPIRLTTLLMALTVCIVVLFGMLGLRRTSTQGANLSDAISEMGIQPLLANHSFADVIKLGHIYQSVPDLIDYKMGTSFLGVFYAPIPRQIWSGKPAISMGREITEKIYNRGLTLKDKGGGTPPGLFGESWINFGAFGFGFCTFAFGLILRWLHNTLGGLADTSEPGAALYGGVMPLFCLSTMGGDFTRGWVQALGLLGVVVMLTWVTRVRWLPRSGG